MKKSYEYEYIYLHSNLAILLERKRIIKILKKL